MRALLQQLNSAGAALDTLSMGMSTDFREAILEGATLIRVGNCALVRSFSPGPRQRTPRTSLPQGTLRFP